MPKILESQTVNYKYTEKVNDKVRQNIEIKYITKNSNHPKTV